jgi:hypothetical protein
MIVPCGNGHEETRQEFEIAICVDGSLEDACYRASFFGRLIDTQGATQIALNTELTAEHMVR